MPVRQRLHKLDCHGRRADILCRHQRVRWSTSIQRHQSTGDTVQGRKVVPTMRNLTDQRPSAFAAACAPVGKAHAYAVGLAAVQLQQPKGWTLSAFELQGITSTIDNSIGTSAKGAGLGTKAADQKVRVYEARGIPPRGRPV